MNEERAYTEHGWRAHKPNPEPGNAWATKCMRPMYAIDRHNDGRPWDYQGNQPFTSERIARLKQAPTCYRCAK